MYTVAAVYNNAPPKNAKADRRIIYAEAEAEGVEQAVEMNKQVKEWATPQPL